MKNSILIVLLVLACVFLVSCDSNKGYIENEANYVLLPGSSWWYEQSEGNDVIQISEIKSINFVKDKPKGTVVKEWNVDENKQGFIKCCLYGSADNYDLYFVGKLIRGNADSNGFFMGFEGVSEISLEHFDTSGVVNMNAMFACCSSLTSLDLSGFDTSNVTDMSLMFYSCKKLATLDISSFNPSKVVDSSFMFYGFGKLETEVKTNSLYADFFKGTELGNEEFWSYSTGIFHCFLDSNLPCYVSFYDGAEVLTQTDIRYGDTLSPFDFIPEKQGYGFFGWYYDSACTDFFDGSKPIKSDTKLYGKWVLGFSSWVETKIFLSELSIQDGDTITVVLSAGACSFSRTQVLTEKNSVSVILGAYALETEGTISVRVKAADETVKGSAQENVTFGTEETFEITVLKEGTDYFNLSFVTNGGSQIPSQLIEAGKTASEPCHNPTRIDYSFDGWYSTPTCSGSPYDFATPVTSDFSLYAKWTYAKTTEKWCVMTYLDLCNLVGSAMENLDEICQSSPNENVKAYFLTGGANKSLSLDDYPNLQRAIKALNPTDPFASSSVSDTYQFWEYTSNGDFVEIPMKTKGMNDSNVLSQFMALCYQRAEASDSNADFKYILELWNHGGGSYVGLIKDFAVESEAEEDKLMSLSGLGNAIKTTTDEYKFKFEVVIFDMCLMQSIEMAHAISPDCANYIIGSQTSSSTYGSAYTSWFNFLYNHPESSGYEFGKMFCDTACAKIKKVGIQDFIQNITWSVLDMSKFEAVEKAFEKYVESDLQSVKVSALEECLDTIDLMAAFNPDNYIRFWEMYMYDINVFVNTMGCSEAASKLISAINEAVAYKQYGIIQENAGCCGLSICILTDQNGWEDWAFSEQWNESYLVNCLTPKYRTFQIRIAKNL